MSDDTFILDQLTLMDIMKTLIKWRRSILLNVFYISILSAIFSLLLPKTYMASAVLMPPSNQSDVSMLNAFSESDKSIE